MIIDGFAGPRGWSEGLAMLGISDIGVEWDAAACATAVAAGHRTIRADVATMPLDHLAGRVQGVIMSPPCQAFSTAGGGGGRAEIDRLAAAIRDGRWDAPIPHREVLEVGRWVETVQPRWVACEQVPPVLPLWTAYAERWRAAGWSCWAGLLCAANFGVPQTRTRAFLLASRDRVVVPPAPTHCRGGSLGLFGELAPWVSMAEALGWPTSWEVGLHRGAGMTERHGERPPTPATAPAPTIRAGNKNGPNLVIREVAEGPAPTICGHRQPRWLYPPSDRTPGRTLNRRQQHNGTPVRNVPDAEPAPTLTGIAGAKGQWVWEQDQPDDPTEGTATAKLTIAEALTLQSFPSDYPVQGTKTKQFEQIGNAVPPLLAAHVLSAVTGTPAPRLSA